MRAGLWAIAGMGLAAMVAMAFASRSLVSDFAGIEEAGNLREALLAGQASVLEPGPSVAVLRVPGQPGKIGWRWKVEATLRQPVPGGEAALDRARKRMVSRALATTIRDVPAAGVILLLRRKGLPDLEETYDAAGIRR